ncbi:MAG TPA: hypothetical protein VJM50_24795 [Pyrinomonadaceae bacterium]|nr:hypothetical protein [Pyrinomonadaceae bacterium]
MSGLCWNTTNFHSAEFAAAGSPFFFPISWTPIIVSSANVFGTNDDPAFFVQWGGRDGAGVRVKLYLFECALTPNPNMRYEAGDNPAVDGGVSVLQASVAVIRTIAAGSPAWKTYANVGSNDKIVHDARRSG